MQRFRFAPELVSEALVLPAPGPADVVVEVVAVALGAEPNRSSCGRVVDAGEAAAHWQGRRVVIPALLPCGDCEPCRRGRAAGCAAKASRNGLATHELVPARFLLSLEPPLWPADWTDDDLWRAAYLAHEAATVFGALMRLGLEPGRPLIVVGDGARARVAVAIGLAKGAIPSTPADAGPASGRRIIETSGSAGGRALALGLAGPGGAVAFVDGLDGRSIDFAPAASWNTFVTDEALLFGATACHPDLYPELAALVVRGQLDLGPLVEAVSLADVVSARADYAAGRRQTLPILRF